MNRNLRIIFEKIKRQNELLELNLKDKIVITEAATGPYFVTAFIAAESGADVTAFVKDSKYGKAEDVILMNEKIRMKYGRECKINFTDKLDEEILKKADVITNSGHLRPIGEDILCNVKTDCVIPLMYEAWEYRAADLDINYCKEKKIKIGATNERHSCIEVFKYLGDMAIKLILDSGLSLYKNKFVLICNSDFGPYIANTLIKVCESVGVIDDPVRRDQYAGGIDHLGNFPEMKITEKYRNADGIIFTAYPFDNVWIGGSDSEIKISGILNEFNNPYLLRFAGDVDTESLSAGGIPFYPKEVKSGHMGILPSDIGYDPVIRLQSGGLKAAQLMLEGKTDYSNELLAEMM